jgi:hypothetical protein
MGETIAFSVCNKPFKPLGFPSGRVKYRESLPEIIPTNIEALCCCQIRISTQTHGGDEELPKEVSLKISLGRREVSETLLMVET